MAQDLTNLYISESFQSLLQVSSSTSASVITNFIAYGTGSLISNLEVTSSYASNVVSASYAATASVILGSIESASYAVTASYALNVTPHESASYAASASNADRADFADIATTATSSISSSFATNASTADSSTSASYAATASILLGSIQSSSYANNSSTSDLATSASYIGGAQVDGPVALAQIATLANLVYGYNVAGEVTSSLSASIATSASHAVQADSALASDTSTSASHAVQADNALTSTTASYALSVDAAGVTGSVTSADEAEKVTYDVQNNEAHTLAKGTPVHITGTTNGTSLVVAASASVAGKMPAHGVLNQQLTAGSDGVATILGQITGVDTSAFTAGDTVYVGASGGYTNVKPTGSGNLIQNLGVVKKIDAGNGTGEIFGSGRSNDLPNIATSSLWIGNEDGVPVAIVSSSIKVDNAVTASFLPSDTRLNITDITASNASFTSASIGYLQSITGSAKIIGDAFIILNSNTPTERYAGIKVEDSGSATTASLQFDSQNNDWFYEYEGDDPTDYGVVMFGPEFATKGSPTYLTSNTIPKGDGGHHLNDSSIVDNGVKVTTTLPISGSGGFIGDLSGNADTATDATNADNIALTPDGTNTNRYVPFTATDNGDGALLTDPGILYNPSTNILTTTTFNGDLTGNATTATSASHALQADNSLTASYATYATASTSASHAVQADASLTSVSASYAPTNVNDAHTFTNVNTFNGQVHGGVTALTITSNTASMDMQDGNFFTLTLQNATDTHLDATNLTAGQTITLTVTNNATAAGTLTFSPDFKFAGGTAPVVTATTSAKDILTFVTTDSTDVFGTSLLNFS